MNKWILLCLLVVCPALSAQSFRLGRAAVDITPPPQMPFQVPQRPPNPVVIATGTHDPLQAKAIVFESGGVKAAIVACDLTSIPVHFIAAARQEISRICTVPPDQVMITATHTHTGPILRPRFYQNGTEQQKKIAGEYLQRLPALIARSVQQAERDLAEARLNAAVGRAPGIAFNRRYVMKDGTVVSNPAKGHDELLVNIVRPAGPTDDALPLVYAEDSTGKPLATLLNFAMHLDTTGGLDYSADFPHYIAKILAEVKGPQMLMHFTIGPAGNINHYDLSDPLHPRRNKNPQEAARIGALLAGETLRTYQQLKSVSPAPLKVSHETLRLQILPEIVPALVRQFGDKPSFHDGEMEITRVDDKYTFEAEVMVITLGQELAFVGMPGEIFVELGLAVKQNSPYPVTFLNELANGSIGYVPNRKALSEGGYGASPGTTRCAPGVGEALVDSAIRQLIAHRAIQPTP